MQEIHAIGIMSGSSLDGVDLCYAKFVKETEKWKYLNCIGETIHYSEEWKNTLRNVETGDARNLELTHANYGHYLGEIVNEFILRNNLKVDLISSHGHTIFHQPKNRFTTQIGDGAAIYAGTGIKTVTNFRNVDIALGGQGAPLVPVGERDLFDDFGMFLNLGGIANITFFDKQNQITAFDISPCNLPLNILCEKYFRKAYDADGLISASGKLDENLLSNLAQLPYFLSPPPKSLGREFILEQYLPIIEAANVPPEDKLYTVSFHITAEIAKLINKRKLEVRKESILVSGGGVMNKFLINLLESKSEIKLTMPNSNIVEFKEALIFAYLGVLRLNNTPNAMASVTSATRNSIGGALWG